MNFKPKLAAFDLDGTLAESKRPLSPEMGALLAELLQKMPVAVLSGASLAQFQTQMLPAFPESAHFEKLYLFPTNAAECFVYRDGAWKLRYDKSFNAFERGRIMQALKESMEETGFAQEPSPVWGERVEDRGAQITFSGLGQKAPIEEKQKWDPSGEKRAPLRAALMRRLPDFEIRTNATTSVDITKKGVNKAYGIRQLVEMTGVSVSEMLYVGDALSEGGNDSVVIDTGVHAHEVFGPDETAALIKDILQAHRSGAAA
ncbi:MAG TPA: HAD-IIB family hydrolase [Candidatus Paceibacterota bacterium]|nr:HAD-IIB family hydrolase [Candidatus Paceibacterota bacterium]